MKRYFLTACVFTLIFSCTQLTPEEKIIKETLGKTIETKMFTMVQEGNRAISFEEFRDTYSFVSLVYLEDGCRPCYPRYVEWQNRMDTLQLNDDFTVLFIIRGMSYDGFLGNLLESDPEYDLSKDRFHIIMDPDQQFMDANRDIPKQIIDKSILIDRENKIRLIGHPFASPQIAGLFNRICNETKK